MSFYNPFATVDLVFPAAYRSQVELYAQTQPAGGSKPSPDDSPFPRMVDVWFLALCIGVKRGKRHQVDSPHRFIMGDILIRDAWRIELLELIAIAENGSGECLAKPADTVALANEYVAGGMPELFAMLSDGPGKPIWNLTDSLTLELGVGGDTEGETE